MSERAEGPTRTLEDEPGGHHSAPGGLRATQGARDRPCGIVARWRSPQERRGGGFLTLLPQSLPEKEIDCWYSPLQRKVGHDPLSLFSDSSLQSPSARRLEKEDLGSQRSAWSGVTCWK